MTTPTPAQVEAVAKAIYETPFASYANGEKVSAKWKFCGDRGRSEWTEKARAAIAAYEAAKEKA